MEEALVAWLLASTDILAIVSGPRAITWAMRPAGLPLPAAVLTVVSRLPDVAMGGRTGIAASRVQVDCYAKTYLAAKSLARAAGNRLAEIRHNPPAGPQATALQGAFPQGERDSFETETGGAGDLYRVSLDFIIWSG